MRILITGGAGFIGSHIAEQALASGHEVLVLDDLSTGRRENVPPKAELVVLDMRRAGDVRAVFDRFLPDAVAHQAAQASVAVSMREPVRDADVNVLGGLSVLEACRATGTKRFVFASTGGAIYGEVQDGTRADELTARAPLSPYGAAKLAIEGYLPTYQRHFGVTPTVLRYANVYGPRQDPHGEAGVVAIFAERALRAAPMQINAMRKKGDDGCVRDYVYVRDVVRANLAALEGKLGEPVLNVGSGVATTTGELARAICVAARSRSTLEPSDVRSGDLERSVLDPSRFENAIGAVTKLDAGLAETLDWFRSRDR
jgi:UDP-glucose 4-epimerase